MTTYTVIESQAAADDLDSIVAYLSGVLKSPSAAKRVLDEYAELLDALEETPFVYPYVRDEIMADAGYKWAMVSSYIVLFRVGEQTHTVGIERIAHSSRNWRRLID